MIRRAPGRPRAASRAHRGRLATVLGRLLALGLAMGVAPAVRAQDAGPCGPSVADPTPFAEPAHAAPGSFPTLPAWFRGVPGEELRGRVEISSPAGWTVLGSPVTDLRLEPGDCATVPVTFQVPDAAAAGRATAARARLLREDGSTAAEVLLEVTVERVHRPRVWPAQREWAAQPGRELELRYVLENGGNGLDTLQVSLDADPGWRISERVATAVLGPGEKRELFTTVRPPTGVRPGTRGRIAWRVEAGGASADGEAFARVEEPEGGTGSETSPLATTIAASAGARRTPRTLDQVRVTSRGTVGRDWQVDFTYQDQPGRDGLILSPLTYGLPTLSLRLRRPGTGLVLGDLGSDLSDLTGSYLVGYGVDAGTEVDGTWFRILAGHPGRLLGGELRDSGHLVGLELRRPLGPLTVTARGSDLRADGLFGGALPERLRAASLELVSPGPVGTRVETELGLRAAPGRLADPQPALAWRARVEREDPGRAFSVAYLHAPVASSAFGPSGDELSGAADLLLLPRVGLHGALRRSESPPLSDSRLRSSGLSVGPRLALGPALSTLLTFEETSTELSGAARFTDHERTGNVRIDGTFGGLLLAAALGAGERATGDEPARTVLAQELHAQWGGAWGTLWGEARRRETAGGSFVDASAFTLGVAGLRLAGPVTLDAEMGRLSSGLRGGSYPRVRLLARAPVTDGFDLRLGAERQPFNSLLTGRDWTLAVELSRSFALPIPVPRGTLVEGIVYRDLDADGRREPGEPALRGVRIEVGSAAARTDQKGEFRLGDVPPGTYAVVIDPASLPPGEGVAWTSPERVTVGRSGRRKIEIPVRAFGSLEGVIFRDDDRSGARGPGEEPAGGLVVVLTPANGPVRTTVSGPDGSFQFGAVLPGLYLLSYVASGDLEPLSRPLEVHVEGLSTTRVEIPARPFGPPVIMTFDGAAAPLHTKDR